jgi:tetratricopeptide (TPR) repeat protein
MTATSRKEKRRRPEARMGKLFHLMDDRLKLRGWIALCLIVASVVWLAQVLPTRFVTERRAAFNLEQAQAHLASGEFDQARTEFRAALRLQPGNREARRQLAAMELRLGHWELAFLEFQSLTELHPEDPDGWIGLADLMVKSGLLEAPEAALDKAIEAAPKRADAHRLRGEIRFRLGRYYGAHLDAQAASAEAPKQARAWVLLVRSAARSNGADAGIEAANRGIAAVGQDPALLLPLARLLSERGRTFEAVKILEQIAAAAGGSVSARDAQLALAGIKLRGGNRDAARRQLDALLVQRPADEEALALRALIDVRDGQVEPALAQLDAALELLPMSRNLRVVHTRLQAARNDSVAVAALLAEMTGRDLGPAPAPPGRLRGEAQTDHGNIAALPRERWPGRLAQMRQALEVQLRQQNWTEAQRIVESARRTYPDTAFGPWLAGILELARGNADGAEKYLYEAMAAAPRSPMILLGMAKTWSRKKGAAFAGDELVRLAERDPAFAFARYLAARAYIDARNPAQAEATLRRGLELQRDSAVPYLHLADYYLELDRAAEALDVCQQGLERFPQNLDLQTMLAQISAGLGKTDNAMRTYEDILSRAPGLDLVVYKLAMLLALQDNDEPIRARSMQIMQHLQADMPSDPVLLDTLGWLHFRAQDTRRARELLEAAVRGAPENPTFHFHLATVYAREKKHDLARNQLKSALESNSSFPERLEALRLLRETGG